MKRFVALVMTGTMLMSQAAFADELPEGHRSADYMQMGSNMGVCEMGDYDKNVTYDAAAHILDICDPVDYQEDGEGRITFYGDEGYITRQEWAKGINDCLDLIYNDIKEELAKNGIESEIQPEQPNFQDKQPEYTDVSADSQYKEAIDNCYKYEIMVGYGDNSFRPEEYITYAEAMASVSKLMENSDGIMEDRGLDITAYYSTVYQEGIMNTEEMDYLTQIMENYTELINKAKDGTLKSDKQLSPEAEKVMEVYSKASAVSTYSDSVHIDEDVDISGKVVVEDKEYNGTISMYVTEDAITDDNGQISEMAGKISYSIASPELSKQAELLGMDTDENGNIEIMNINMYIKDNTIYTENSLTGQKVKIKYDPEQLEEMDISSPQAVMGMSQMGTELDKDAMKLLNEYMFRECAKESDMTENENGSKDISVVFDTDALYSMLDLDINKLIELLGSEGSVNIGDISQNVSVDENDRIIASTAYVPLDINTEGFSADGEVNVATNYEYGTFESINFPDFSEYEDMEDIMNGNSLDVTYFDNKNAETA